MLKGLTKISQFQFKSQIYIWNPSILITLLLVCFHL